MTRPTEIERVLDQWLGDGPVELPDRVLLDALIEIDHTHQRGAQVVPWRFNEMPIPLRLLLVAALVVATAGAAFIAVGAVRQDQAPPTPTSKPTSAGPGLLIGSDPQGEWTAARPAAYGSAGGEYQLVIQAPVRLLLVDSPEGQQILLGSVTLPETGVVELGPTDRCPETGSYRYAVGEGSAGLSLPPAPGNRLLIETIADSCSDRRTVFEGEWSRLWTTWELSLGQRYRTLTPGGSAIDFTIPAALASDSGSRPNVFGEAIPPSYLAIETDELSLWILDGRGASSARCHATGVEEPFPATLEGFDGWVGSDTGLTLSGATSLTIAGLPARRVDVAGGAACDEPWDNMQPLMLPRNGHVRDWAIDVGDRLLILTLVNEGEAWAVLPPEALAAVDELLASMEITVTP